MQVMAPGLEGLQGHCGRDIVTLHVILPSETVTSNDEVPQGTWSVPLTGLVAPGGMVGLLELINPLTATIA